MVDEEKQEEVSQEQASQTQTIEKPPIEPPKKKSNAKWWILGGCGCVTIIIIIALIAALIGFGGFKLFKSIQAPVAPIKGQLKALNDGDIDKAYNDYTSNGFKKITSLEQFKLVVESNPQIFKSKSSSFTDVKIENKQAIVKGTITGKDGTLTKIRYDLVLENDEWKIYGFSKQ